MAFSPQLNKNVEIAVTDVSSRVAIDTTWTQCRVWNAGPDACHVKYGDNTVTAADDDMIIPPGFAEVHIKGYVGYIAAKCRSGQTAVLHAIVGSGD